MVQRRVWKENSNKIRRNYKYGKKFLYMGTNRILE